MPDNMLGVLQTIGFGVLLYCTLIGAYAQLRWGFVGVKFFWSKRKQIDQVVEKEIDELESVYNSERRK